MLGVFHHLFASFDPFLGTVNCDNKQHIRIRMSLLLAYVHIAYWPLQAAPPPSLGEGDLEFWNDVFEWVVRVKILQLCKTKFAYAKDGDRLSHAAFLLLLLEV